MKLITWMIIFSLVVVSFASAETIISDTNSSFSGFIYRDTTPSFPMELVTKEYVDSAVTVVNSSIVDFNYSNYFDQELNTTSAVNFESVIADYVTGSTSVSTPFINIFNGQYKIGGIYGISSDFGSVKITDDLEIYNFDGTYSLILNNTGLYDWTDICDYISCGGSFDYDDIHDQELNTTKKVQFKGMTIFDTENSTIQISSNGGNPVLGAVIDLLETNISFGNSGAYGFRIFYDGSGNKLRIQSGQDSAVTDIISINRANQYLGYKTTAPTDPFTVNAVARFTNTVKFGTGGTTNPIIAHRSDENTGINFPVNDFIDLTTSGTPRIRISTISITNSLQTIMRKARLVLAVTDLSKNVATPSVIGANIYTTDNTLTTTITNFLDGIEGQIIRIICTDTYTTVQDNTNIYLEGSTDFACNSNYDVLELVYYDRTWIEISRSDN